MYSLLRPLLFSISPEKAHFLALNGLDVLHAMHASSLLKAKANVTPTNVMGIEFPNPVGLAAGLDKNGDHIDSLAALGFGFIEIGTITPKPQDGNLKPRLFRLPEHEAVINRMGFNNKGVDYLVAQVDKAKFDGVLGINIGKNKVTPNENAVDDYLHCMDKVYPLASYITVNLSSPNTPGLRDLQFGEPLRHLLEQLKNRQQALAAQHGKYIPLALKVAPDMALTDIDDVAQALIEFEIDGLIATNTTIDRSLVAGHPLANEAGGLSGVPVCDASTKTVAAFSERLEQKLPIIGVGGIHSTESAEQKIAAGAQLLQIYSGFLYQGPALISKALKAFES